MYRHGDVLIAPVPSIPASARPRPGLILARGEITGHSHRVEPSGVGVLFEQGEDLYLRVDGPGASVVHEEHRTIQLPQGFYRVWRQREYSPAAIRRVVD